MRNFTNVHDIGDLHVAVKEALEVKNNRFGFTDLGKNKTLLMIFFNSSLRTRLSTQKAAMNLGMNVMVLDVNQGAWKLETERGVIMDGDKADLSLASLADLITIEEFKTKERPKVVMTWAPHPKALPQAVPNSFAEWMNATDYEFVITHPHGYELAPEFVGNARVEYDQRKALEGADFVYAKNWSAYADPNYGKVLSTDRSWTVDTEKMGLTANASSAIPKHSAVSSPNSPHYREKRFSCMEVERKLPA